jgi:hypothetical protein
MNGHVLTILVLAVAMAATIVIALLLLRGFGDKAERRADDLRDEAERLGEEWVIPMEGASYRGARHTYGRVKGNGVAGLTRRRIVFEPLLGAGFGVPLARVTEVRVTRWFLGAARARGRHLVLVLDDGNEVGFFFRDRERWLRALAELGVRRGAEDGSSHGG